MVHTKAVGEKPGTEIVLEEQVGDGRTPPIFLISIGATRMVETTFLGVYSNNICTSRRDLGRESCHG